jgi:predicted Zn-dependent protease with MMP-like domain
MDHPSSESEDFEALVDRAVDRIPSPFYERLDSVAIVVEDTPSAELLAATRAPGLFGVYQGVPRTAWGVDNVALPSKITIFRIPHIVRFRDPEALARAVEATVFHEVAHHFGISDDRLRELQRG